MQDFYGNNTQDFSNNAPSIEQLQLQGLELGRRLDDPFDTINGFDWLINRYPALNDRISKARGAGFSDEEINSAMLNMERRLNFFGKPNEVNQVLGRSEQSMSDDAAYLYVKQFQAFRQAFPDKNDDEIFNAIELSRLEGVNLGALLQSKELYNAFLRGQKERESIYESAIRGGKNYLTGNDNGALGVQFITGHITREELFKGVQDNSKNFIQEPKIQTFGNKVAAGVSGILAQGYKNSGKGILAGAATALPLGAAGAFIGMGKPFAHAGFKAGYYGAMAWELFEDQAGNDVYELLQMTDENGQPLDENVARITACITGAVTVATELAAYKYLLNLIPGGNNIKQFLGIDRQHVINAVRSNPVLRDTFSRIAIDMTKGIGVSTLNNIIEAVNTDLKIPLAQAISDQPFPQLDWRKWAGDTLEHVQDTAVSSLRDFTGSALLSFLFDPRQTNLWKTAKWARDFKQSVKNISDATGLPQADVEKAIAENIRAQQLKQIEQKYISEQQNSENENTISETAPQEISHQQSQPNFIYIPADAFRQFTTDNPDFKGQEAFRAGVEVALSPQVFENIKNDDNGKAFINSIADDVRLGADGRTFAEETLRTLDTEQDKAEIFHSTESQKLYDDLVPQLENAGLSHEEADIIGNIARVANTVALATDGIPIIPVSVETPEQATDFSRINSQYDINNPQTWPNQEKAQQYSELLKQAKLPDIIQSTKDILDIISGKKPALGEELSDKSSELFEGIKGEMPAHINSTMRDLLREELNDYRFQLQASGLDVMDSIAALQLDPQRYSINNDFPRGKSRNPDFSYSFSQQGHKSKIDFAVDGINLTARLKIQGRNEPLIFSVKNFRTASLPQVISDLTSGNSLAGVPLADTPTAQNIADAFSRVWQDLGLNAVPTQHEDFSLDAPITERTDDFSIQKPDTVREDLTLDVKAVNDDSIPIEIITSPTDTSKMPFAARKQLNRDLDAWRTNVEEYLTNPQTTTNSRQEITVMQTPLVLTLLGAKHLPLKINNGKLLKILSEHSSMTPELLMEIPKALADPIAIFPSATGGKDSLVFLTDLKDNNGASVLSAVYLDQRNGTINKIASAYPKIDRKNNPKNQWFRDQIQEAINNGSPLYVNTVKAQQWTNDTGIQLMQQGDIYTHTEEDLIRLWNLPEQKGFYFTDPDTGLPSAEYYERGSKGFIRYFKSAMNNALNRASRLWATVHELGHNMFSSLQMRARNGSIQSLQDRNTIITHAGFTVEQFEADKHIKGGVKEKVNEYAADAWQSYIAEGKAPSQDLQKVFDRARDFSLDTYGDISSQLRVSIDDDLRAVFDRMLTIPRSLQSSVADFALDDLRISRQIKEYERLRDEEQRKLDEAMQLRQDVQDNPQNWEIDEQSAQLVQDYIYQTDYREIQQDELKAQQDFAREVIAAIKSTGLGISRADVITYFGKENLRTFYDKWRGSGVYVASDSPMADRLADALADLGYFQNDATDAFGQGHGDIQALMNWLMDFDKSILNQKIDNVPPNVDINTGTLNAFLAQLGVDGTLDYLKQRAKLINDILKSGADLTSQQVESLISERNEINDWLSRLDTDLDNGIKPPKRHKHKISKSDLRQGIMTGYRLGRQEEREFSQLHEKHALDTQRDILSERQQKLLDDLRAKREADKVHHQERLQTIMQREQQKHDAQHQRLIDRFQRRINTFNQRINNIKNSIAQFRNRRDIKQMVKSIFRMSKSKSISWDKLQQINNLLQAYNLDRKGITHRDLLRQFIDIQTNEGEQYTQDFADEFAAQNNISQQDVDDFLSVTHIEDMTLQQVQDLFAHVKDLFRQGREEFIQWRNDRDNRRADMSRALLGDLDSFERGKSRIPRDNSDLTRQYVSNIAHSYWNSVQLPGRFLRGLGENFRRIFEDGFTQKRGEAFRWINLRENGFWNALEKNGVSIKQLWDNAITVDGHNFSWEEALSIYLGMKNDKHRDAILYGNFVVNNTDSLKPYTNEQDAMRAIGNIIQAVNEKPRMKAIAEWIVSDFNQHFDRINRANINNFNRGMNHEDNYSPMFRLQHQDQHGVNSFEIEAMTINANNPQTLQDVADNFLFERKNLSPEQQQPVNLKLISVWFDAMHMQEFNAALGGYAADIRSALLSQGEGTSVQQAIKERLGNIDWNTLIDIYNNSINDNLHKDMSTADKIVSVLVKARSAAYVPFNPATALSQFSSYITALPYAGGHLLRSLWKAMKDAPRFLQRVADKGFKQAWRETGQFRESVYEKSPELRYTAGDPIDKEFSLSLERRPLESSNKYLNSVLQTQPVRGAANLFRRGLAWGYGAVQFIDNWTKSIVFDAVYDKNIDRGLSHEEAVRLADRAVRDTQPASTNREKAQFSRGGPLQQLFFSQFMNALMPLFNMTFVDTAYNLTHGGWNTVKNTAFNLVAVGLTFALAGAIKDAFNGRLFTGRERDDGSVDDFPSWLAETELSNLLNVIPIVNRFFDAGSSIRRLFDAGSSIRGFKYRAYDRLTEPVERIVKGIRDYGKYDGEFNGKSIENIIHGVALLGLPIPYSGIRQFLRLFGLYGNDDGR